MNDATLWAVSLAIAHLVICLVAAVLISMNRRPTSAIAWVLAIIFVPYLGILFFLLIGVGKLPRHRRAQQAEVNRLVTERTAGLSTVGNSGEWPTWLGSLVRLNRELGSLPMVGGNRVRLLPDYVGSIEAMVAAIDRAEYYVHVEFYILVHDQTTHPFFEALRRACERGVTVRVLSDFVTGFQFPNRRETRRLLREMGAEWLPLLPLVPWRGQWQRPDMRNHRKIVVVDGYTGFMGSQNMIDSSYLKKKNVQRGLHWHELMVEAEGPIVRELNAVFLTDWYSESGELLPIDTTPVVFSPRPELVDAQVVPSGPSFDNDNNLKLFVALIHQAERRISITSPYFVPDESLLIALITAAARGVAVELFVSEVADQVLVYHAQRSYYESLLAAGVRIHLYRAPTVLHSKHFSIDDEVAVIGSSNMDIRSFALNMEVSMLVHGRGFVTAMRAVEDDYRRASIPLDLAEWVNRPLRQKVADNLARLTSELQ
ncbi:cardiolipin synthase [Klugiella xanthotipulae]|uniref:Cardiolipin synthase n=1 Tax=Klugiella xanthotipulae TaxID=244735 RepID=A0A543HYX0_9MICO|nr:cardiolipin synthase [Klugiella xanthotipulae]TQM63534.1 cardiolipin synthetase 2 [Klugiella xanthotipulae]